MSTDFFMGSEKPLASYTKTILGKLQVMIINHITNEQESVILSGNPKDKKDSEDCIIDVWSVREDQYLKRANRKLFEMGQLIPIERKEYEPTESELLNSIPDEEIEKLLRSKFYSLQSVVNKITSIAPLFRFLQIAKELEKSEKIIKFIEGRISELQMKEYEIIEDA